MRKLRFKNLLVMLSAFLIMLSFNFTAKAAGETINIKIAPADQSLFQEVYTKLTGVASDGSTRRDLDLEFKTTQVAPSDTKLLRYSNGTVVFNLEGFQKATDKSRKRALNNFIDALQDSPVSQQTQQNIFNTMKDADSDVARLLVPMLIDSTEADLFNATRILKPFLPFVRIVFGIGAFVIIILLIFSSIVDLCFIGLPVAREAMSKKGNENGGKIPFVSADAESVVKEYESNLGSSGKYKNVYVAYFKRRAITYIVLAICILYLVVGELGGVIAWLMSLGDGLLGK